MNLPYLMLDLETLGPSPGGCIVQIGAVRFDPYFGDKGLISTPAGEFRQNVINDTGHIDYDTVLWWMKQSEEARQRVFFQGGACALNPALHAFREWVDAQGEPEQVWCNLDFDLPILKAGYKRCGHSVDRYPFNRKQGRDWRTLRDLGDRLGIKEPLFVGVEHDALDDAHHQAIWATNILRKIDG